jgi:hypothetical protein
MSGASPDSSPDYTWLSEDKWEVKNKDGLDPLIIVMPKDTVSDKKAPSYVRLLIGENKTGPVLRWTLSESADQTRDITVVKKTAEAGTLKADLKPATARQFKTWWALHSSNQGLTLASLVMTSLAALCGGSLLIGKYWHPFTVSSGQLAATQTLAIVFAFLGSLLTIVKTYNNPAP